MMPLRFDQRPFVFVEDRLNAKEGGRLFVRPKKIIACHRHAAVSAALREVAKATADGLYAAGYVAYDAFPGLEPKLVARRSACGPLPLVWFGLFEEATALSADELDATFGRTPPAPPITEAEPRYDRDLHGAKVEKILSLIRAGDLYQANLTFPIRFRYGGDVVALYAALRTRQAVAHGTLIAMDEVSILSVSPELFFSVRSGMATVRPMKGTVARCSDPTEDSQARAALRSNPKQLAENLMIVDLLRNDLSRVSQPGSVKASNLFSVESYPAFHSMTSTVEARLRAGVDFAALMEALFPCGSVVGAPKIRAAEVISELEDVDRGVYTGALGWWAPSGEGSFSVAIRTAVIDADGEGVFGVGGGIVADSDPSAEYDEALLKARILTDLAREFQLIETFRWRRETGFVRLAAHRSRLAVSAAKLGFKLDLRGLSSALAAEARKWGDEDRRVRVLLSRTGEFAISSTALEADLLRPLRMHVGRETIDPGDPFLGHKTTSRDLHERALAEATAMNLDEAVLLNRRGRVADATRSSVFVEIDGRLITPSAHCGALPGVLRAEMIASRKAAEGELVLSDLERHPVWLGSSLRGLRRAHLCPGPADSHARGDGSGASHGFPHSPLEDC